MLRPSGLINADWSALLGYVLHNDSSNGRIGTNRGKTIMWGKSAVLSVAGSVMMAGGAMAVDLPPIEFSATTPLPPVAAGPKVSIDITKEVYVRGPGVSFGTDLDFDVGVMWASGWGIEIGGGAGANIEWPTNFSGGFDYRIYRAIGDFELGVGGFASAGCSVPPLLCGGAFGFNANLFYEYESDRLSVQSENFVSFFPVFGFNSNTELEFQATDKLLLGVELWVGCNFSCWGFDTRATYNVTDNLEVWALLALRNAGFRGLELGAVYDVADMLEVWAQLSFDNIGGFDRIRVGANHDVSEWLEVFGSIGFRPGDWWATIGADLEDQIGDGPFSLVGWAFLSYNSCCGPNFGASIGINYAIGDPIREDLN